MPKYISLISFFFQALMSHLTLSNSEWSFGRSECKRVKGKRKKKKQKTDNKIMSTNFQKYFVKLAVYHQEFKRVECKQGTPR